MIPPYFSIKEAVFPFNKFPGVDPILGPEMRSTGEVMGVGRSFGEAMLKSQLGAGSRLPTKGTVVDHGEERDKDRAVKVAGDLVELGFKVVATKGTAAAIAAAGVPVKVVNKVKDGRPHIADMVKAGEIQLVFTTVDETRTAIADSRYIRTAALANRVTYYTTMAGCEAATEALKHQDDLTVHSCRNCTPNWTKLRALSAAAAGACQGAWRRIYFFSATRCTTMATIPLTKRGAESSRKSCSG